MRTGANSHGTEHDASTASPTRAAGAPGRPNTTRRPLLRATATTRRRPSNRCSPDASIRARRPLSVSRGRGAARSTAARAAAAGGAASDSASGTSGAPRSSANAPARSPACAVRSSNPKPSARPPSYCSAASGSVEPATGRFERSAGSERRRDDRAGGRADEVVAALKFDLSRVLDPGEDAAEPGLTENPAGTEHEHVGT